MSLHIKIDADMCKFNLLAVTKSRSSSCIYIYIQSELGIAVLYDYILYMPLLALLFKGGKVGKQQTEAL